MMKRIAGWFGVAWKEFRWADDLARTNGATARDPAGAMRWATPVAHHFCVVPAVDGRVVRTIELYRENPGE